MVKVRFAPSPTGYLHVGNAKTALINFLFSRSVRGRLVLRIEDTDMERSHVSFEKSIMEDLSWLGIEWDEGPIRQTDRFDLYREYARVLMEQGAAYKCFCSHDELEESRSAALKKGLPPRYNGKCRDLSAEDAARLEAEGRQFVVRFKSLSRPISFTDAIHGEISFPRDHVDDFILMKQEGTPSYNFAVVVDDMDMGITHVIRGADHISNTPKQIMLFEVLGGKIPRYAHHSLLVGEDKKPLSKRHGASRVRDFRDLGILPPALRNYLGIIGRNVPGEIMDSEELAATFSLESLSKADSVFDMEKLIWFNKEYMKSVPLETLLGEMGLSADYADRINVLRENAATMVEMKDYLRIFEHADMSEGSEAYLRQVHPSEKFIEAIKEMITTRDSLNSTFDSLVSSLVATGEFKKKDVFMILRIFLTGRRHGPPLKEMFPLIPLFVVTERLDKYLVSREEQTALLANPPVSE